jgi:pimeloyl-ACP methyl ester carboxylesterase
VQRTLGVLVSVGLVSVGLVATALTGVAAPVFGAPGPTTATVSVGAVVGSPAETIRVGSMILNSCDIGLDHTWCGSVPRPWDPARPDLGTISVGFAYRPPAADPDRIPRGVVVPHEGGPGYATTASAGWFADMYAGVLTSHALLLVDERGTGRSEPVVCPALDAGLISYVRAAGLCGRSLGQRSDLYSSRESADDLAAVLDALAITRIDFYGDSYGTFFGQVFAGRHPDRLRTLILDGAYPTYGESAWYPTQGPALRRALRVVCARSPVCTREGDPMRQLGALLARVRRDIETVRAPGGDGRMHRVEISAPALAAVAFNATYLSTTYEEFTAAVRAALSGDLLPIGRLIAEYYFSGATTPAPDEYSEGQATAVSCLDYPQMFDLRASLDQRRVQYADAISAMQQRRPGIYAPFSIKEYLRAGWSTPQMCLQWPEPQREFGPPRPVGGYARIPTLVLSGEIDTITTAAEGDLVAEQIPGARHIIVANTTHVTAGAGGASCGAYLVRQMIRSANASTVDDSCARAIPPLVALGAFPETLTGLTGLTGWRRIARGAVATAADVVRRLDQSWVGYGPGLRGGTWTWDGRVRLDAVRFVKDLPVTGSVAVPDGVHFARLSAPGVDLITARWRRDQRTARVTVRIDERTYATRVAVT